MQTIVFSTDGLPAGSSDQTRVALWRDFSAAMYGPLDIDRSHDRPFWIRFKYLEFGNVGIGDFAGAIVRSSRARGADGDDRLILGVNKGQAPMSVRDGPRESVLLPGAMVLVDGPVGGGVGSTEDIAWQSIHVPRRRLLDLVGNAEDAFGRAIDPRRPALRYLHRYLDLSLRSDDIGDDPALAALVATTLTDLIALALGAEGDAAVLAGMRGLRAARLREALAEIRAGFTNPGFSPWDVALKLGVTTRYVQDLLHQTGLTFTERVMELRLQKARAMLANPRHEGRRISDIALDCGFNEVPYFNRCFRRRFGGSPTQFRGRGDVAG